MIPYLKISLLPAVLLVCISSLSAQTYRVDSVYLGATGYTEYLPGNMPLIFAASHGGRLTPSAIPTRNCAGCVTTMDLNTQELARQVREAVHTATGCYPHVIINLLHRSKLDANRDLIEAAQGNPDAEQAWKEYHTFLDSAKQQVIAHTQRGLFIDLHGHGHSIQRLELGYLLSGTTLRLPDTQLNTDEVLKNTSIRQLARDNRQNLEHAHLIRGEYSLGTLLEREGYPAVPSSGDPAPKSSESYFSGGYSTERHGSAFEGSIDAIQMECNLQGVRDTEISREFFAASLTTSLLEYLQRHYFEKIPACQVATPVAVVPTTPIQVFPNPGCGSFHVQLPEAHTMNLEASVLDGSGRVRARMSDTSTALELAPSRFSNGLYWLVVKQNGHLIARKPLLQQCP